jgi:hypothetical protein
MSFYHLTQVSKIDLKVNVNKEEYPLLHCNQRM